MKTMKNWRKSRLSESHANSFANGRTGAIYAIAFAMLAAFSLASCSSDDDEEFLMDKLAGTWEQVYDEGVVSEGYIQYTFTPKTPSTPSTAGECTIHVYDVFAGDTTFVRDYVLTEDRHLAIYSGHYGATAMEFQEYDVQRLSAKAMTWHLTNSDVVLNFKKVK